MPVHGHADFYDFLCLKMMIAFGVILKRSHRCTDFKFGSPAAFYDLL